MRRGLRRFGGVGVGGGGGGRVGGGGGSKEKGVALAEESGEAVGEPRQTAAVEAGAEGPAVRAALAEQKNKEQRTEKKEKKKEGKRKRERKRHKHKQGHDKFRVDTRRHTHADFDTKEYTKNTHTSACVHACIISAFAQPSHKQQESIFF